MITPALGLPVVPAVEADTIDFPHGTISGYVDREAGVLRFFSEPLPHPVDEAMAFQLAAIMGGGGVTWRATADVTESIVQITCDPLQMVG